MDNTIEEYLSSSQISQKELSNDEFVDYYYERKVSMYRSSTIMITESLCNFRQCPPHSRRPVRKLNVGNFTHSLRSN